MTALSSLPTTPSLNLAASDDASLVLDSDDLNTVNVHLESASAEDVLAWASQQFGEGLVMTSSFGAQSAVMLHLLSRVAPEVPVILIDTGYLFPETYRFANELTEQLSLKLKVYSAPITPAHLEAIHGKLWEQGPLGLRKYHQITKVEPMQRALEELRATGWIAGLRASQTDHRASLKRIDEQDGITKIHPILNWSSKQVHEYLTVHDLPYHPLVEKGYLSIGDTHSTRPITEGMDERQGRFHGHSQECGLHLPANAAEDASRSSSDL